MANAIISIKGNFAIKIIRAKELALDLDDLESEGQPPFVHFTGTMSQLVGKKVVDLGEETLEYRDGRIKVDGWANGAKQSFDLEIRVDAEFSTFDNVLNKASLDSILTIAGELIVEENGYFVLPNYVTFATFKTPISTTTMIKGPKSTSLFSKRKSNLTSKTTKSALLQLCTPQSTPIAPDQESSSSMLNTVVTSDQGTNSIPSNSSPLSNKKRRTSKGKERAM